ncbi:hypothetical protein [Polaribacter sp. IC073]|uniref:hypothetical protein n=1 Tax=Polaribacter sp. IC073 TaxID=2508540 RepID=UPI001674F87C|nr:hypothetical protein [Polaribacter sp. IC073]
MSKKEAKAYFDKLNFEALENKKKVSVASKGNNVAGLNFLSIIIMTSILYQNRKRMGGI